MKKKIVKKNNKYHYKWELEFKDWLSLVILLVVVNYIMLRLIIGAL